MLNSIPAKICFICVNHLFVKGSQRLTYCLTLTNFLIILACLAFWGTKYNESDSPIASDCIINNFSCLCIILRLPGFLSALAGGFSYILPTLVAVLLFKVFPTKSRSAKLDVVGGEVLKVVLSLVSMLVVFCDMASITWYFTHFYWRFLASVIWFF